MAEIKLGKYFTPKIIINISIIVGFLILATWLIAVLSSELESKAQSIQEQRLEIASRIRAISELAELREAAEEAEPAIATLNNVLPKRDELVAFPRYLENLADKNKVTLGFNFIGEELEASNDKAGQSSFTIDILGGYANVLNFIEGLEEGTFLIDLNSFNIALERDGFDVELTGVIYFRG